MRQPLHATAFAGAAALCLSVAACVVAPANPYPPVPAARVEVIPPPPRAALVWQPGAWHWNGAGYQWMPGHYIERAPGHRFVPGHWVRGPYKWRWVPGGWM
ncbi:MAG: hypothetical protein BGP12_10145 [Rhodospirillales bacterium 70-18]|nr:YXWGXW repeat-containing protein [Rhodospirillales bacterium]OJY63402.1 MAG: hypothetical protein BGP12_10145 [Rhodospirillales bacterium 70-18]